MRVTTELWVAALTRRVFGAGDYAAVLRRGSSEAGAVFVVTRNRLGEVRLFGPAPQTSYDEARPDDRYFTLLYEGEDQARVDDRLARETRFDPDTWIVEVELGRGAVEDLIPVRTP